MVNTGKPSRGCYMCRARRIKCDEGKPSCMRCQKSKRICPGYRDLFELKLRDETKSTKRKLSSGYNRHRPLTPEDLDNAYCRPYNNVGALVQSMALPPFRQESDWIDYNNYPWGEESFSPTNTNRYDTFQGQSRQNRMAASRMFIDHPTLIKQPLSTPVDQQAVCFFLANYVLVPGAGTLTSRGHLDFLLPLLKTQPANSPLALTFTSVGLATMAVRPNSRALMPMASSTYIKALKQINFALKDPSTAMSDTTLATILLLTVFEQITSSGMDMKGWSSHIHGAVAIIKARDRKSFRTPMGRELFVAVREVMTIHYIGKSLPVEPSIDWWLHGVVSGEDPFMEVYAEFNLRVAELRQENDKTTSLSPQTPSNIASVLFLLHRAQDLEREYREWYTSLPPRWKPDPVAWVDWSDMGLSMGADLSGSIAHPGRVDMYNELSLAYAYNVARSSQILIWTTILRCVAWLGEPEDYRITTEHKEAAQVCAILIEDIVASIPYFFGWNADTDPSTATSPKNVAGDSVKGVSGVFLMFPLWVACSSDFVSETQRVFLRGRLAFIAESMGICQAKILLNAPIRHPSLYIMHEKMNLRRGSDTYPSPTFSCVGKGTPSPIASMASSSWQGRGMTEIK